jgi:tRNA-2-methylthio-N6-dimethylallyladenosine synthase
MAERLKETLFSFEPAIDILAGPDSYRDLPELIINLEQTGHQTANIILSTSETYDDIKPVRLQSNGVSAFISIMRGCENF